MVEDCFSEVGEQVETIWFWRACCMIRRRQGERSEPEGPEPTTYLGLAVANPDVGGRGGVRPMVTGAEPVPPALPASGPWAGGDPCGNELPLGFSIEEVGALGGAGGQYESMSGRVEIAAPAQVSGETSGER
jgi:hypothetical protein